jgi:hypothetical protein
MKDRLFDQVKKAQEAASAKADELKAKSAEVKGQLLEQAGEMREAGINKLKQTITDFNAALPVLSEAGYVLDAVQIGLGIPPKIVAMFSVGSPVGEEKFQELLAANEERKLTIVLMKSIHEATKLQSRIKIKGLRPSSLAVELGLIPEIGVRFKRFEERPAFVEEEPEEV